LEFGVSALALLVIAVCGTVRADRLVGAEPWVIAWTSHPPEIDGVKSAKEWDHAVEVPFVPCWPADARIPNAFLNEATAARALWDSTNLYLLLGSTAPPTPAQAEPMDPWTRAAAKGMIPPPETPLPPEVWVIVMDPRGPSTRPDGHAAPSLGGYEIVLHVGHTRPETNHATVLLQTRSGVPPGPDATGLSGRAWIPPGAVVAAKANPGMIVELAVPFDQFHHRFGGGRGLDGAVLRDLSMWGPPMPGTQWDVRMERHYDDIGMTRWGDPLPPYCDRLDAAKIEPMPPVWGVVRFDPPPPEDFDAHATFGHVALPPYMTDQYVEAARRSQAERKPLLVIYTLDSVERRPEMQQFWDDPRVHKLAESMLVVRLNAHRPPETSPDAGVARLPTILLMTPRGRIAARWTNLPTYEQLEAAVRHGATAEPKP